MRKKEEGFTLIELMVTIGIMVIINGVIFFNYPKVMANLALRRTADEIALTARQAQAYAMAAKTVAGASTPPGYGVHFNISDPYSIILFADLDSDDTYDGTGEDVQTFEIQTKDQISNLICTGSSGRSCATTVDIVYSRQKPTSDINWNGSSSWDSVKITITARRDSTMQKCVNINKNGYISIGNC